MRLKRMLDSDLETKSSLYSPTKFFLNLECLGKISHAGAGGKVSLYPTQDCTLINCCILLHARYG